MFDFFRNLRPEFLRDAIPSEALFFGDVEECLAIPGMRRFYRYLSL
jgi:hypothetical protein